MAQISKPEQPRSQVHDVLDHQVLLSFNGDRDAELFDEWWQDEGFAAFSGWAAKLDD